MAAYRQVYDSRHLQADWDQLGNPTLGNRVWATFLFTTACYVEWPLRMFLSTLGRYQRHRKPPPPPTSTIFWIIRHCVPQAEPRFEKDSPRKAPVKSNGKAPVVLGDLHLEYTTMICKERETSPRRPSYFGPQRIDYTLAACC